LLESTHTAIENSRYKEILDFLPYGVQILDFQWRCLYVNDAFASQVNLKKENLLGATLKEIYPEIENSPLFQVLKSCMQERSPQQYEKKSSPKDDSSKCFLLKINPTEEGILILQEDISSYKTDKITLNQIEQRFRVLIEKSSDMKTLADRNGRLIYTSPSVSKTLGYSSEELLQKSIFDLIHPEDLPSFKEKRDEILGSNGATFQYQRRMLCKNGEWIWCEGTVTNLLEEPSMQAILSNFRNISENKKAEQQIEFDRQNLKALINNSNDLMWSVDTNFNLITSNDLYDQMMEKTLGKVMEKGSNVLQSNFPKSEILRYKSYYERAFKGEIFSDVYISAFENKRWMEVFLHPIIKENKVIGTACVCRDITDNKLAEEKLKLSEKSLLEAQEIAHLGSWEMDLRTGKTQWSEETCRIHGMPPNQKEQNFEVWTSFLHPEDREPTLAIVEESKRTLEETAINHRIVLKDGTIKHIFTKAKFKLDEKGKPIGIHGISHDITERKETEERLLEKNSELEKTNEELDRFVYSASHDLRSPLTSIMGLVSFILDESKESETLKYAKMIRNSILKLDEFIKNILSYSRNTRTALGQDTIQIKETIEDIIDSLKNMKEAADIAFEIDIQENTPFISDKHRFKIVMENLISNAIKYSHHDNREKFIKISGKTDKDYTYMRVEDNGIGIPAQYHGRIFDMFFRLANNGAGSGIGLYIVKEIVEKMQGIIEIDSNEGKGTTFMVKLKNFA
jgi:PAS domain S-box-containing protein